MVVRLTLTESTREVRERRLVVCEREREHETKNETQLKT